MKPKTRPLTRSQCPSKTTGLYFGLALEPPQGHVSQQTDNLAIEIIIFNIIHIILKAGLMKQVDDKGEKYWQIKKRAVSVLLTSSLRAELFNFLKIQEDPVYTDSSGRAACLDFLFGAGLDL